MIIQIAQKIINKIANRFREVMYLPILIFKKYFINTLTTILFTSIFARLTEDTMIIPEAADSPPM